MRTLAPAAGLSLCLLLAPPAQAQTPRPAAAGTPKAVLLVTLDTTRADRLGCYGGSGGLTPSLDEFARRATLFERCEASIPQTMPSHTTVFSGLQPNRHGVRKNLEVRVPEGIPFIPQEFARAGFATGAFVSSYVLMGRYGMSRGFGTYDDTFWDPRDPTTLERRADETLGRALAWIGAQKGPWLCWVHLFDPHDPYAAPEPYGSRFAKAPYDGEVAFMDAQLGRFLAALGQRGQLDGAVVVVFGDHGEALGDHGEPTHGVFLYESTTRVPLLVRLPGQSQARRVAGPVGLVDLAPTLRDLCGLPPANACDGASLAGALGGGPAPTSRPIYLESLEGLYSFGWAPLYARVEGDHKFILAPRMELYDLAADPGEGHNLAPSQRERALKMRAGLSAELERPQVAPGRALDLDQAEMESLRSLGYIAGTPGKAGATYADPKDKVEDLADQERARQLLNEKRYAEAAPIYERLCARDPKSSYAAYNLAGCYQDRDPQRALRHVMEAIRLRPDFPQAYQRALTLLINGGRFTEAKRLGDLGLKQTADHDGAIATLTAWASYMAGSPEAEVVRYLDRAARGGAELFMGHKLRAVLALKRGDSTAALEQVRRFAALAPPAEVAKLGKDPMLEPLREDPAFWKIVLGAGKP